MKSNDYKRVAGKIKCSDEFRSRMVKALEAEPSSDDAEYADTVTEVEHIRSNKMRYIGMSIAACAVIGVTVGVGYVAVNKDTPDDIASSSYETSSDYEVSSAPAATSVQESSSIFQENEDVKLHEAISGEATTEEMNDLFEGFSNFENELFLFNYCKQMGQVGSNYTIRGSKSAYDEFIDLMSRVKWGRVEFDAAEVPMQLYHDLYNDRFYIMNGAILFNSCISAQNPDVIADNKVLYYVPYDEKSQYLYAQAVAVLDDCRKGDRIAIMLDSIETAGYKYDTMTADIKIERTVDENINDDENNLISVEHNYSGKIYMDTSLMSSEYIIQVQGQKQAVSGATTFDVKAEYISNAACELFVESGDELDMFYGGVGMNYINNTQVKYIDYRNMNSVGADPIDYFKLSAEISAYAEDLRERAGKDYHMYHSSQERNENSIKVYEYRLVSDIYFSNDLESTFVPEWELTVKLDETGNILYYERKENGVIVDKIELTNVVYDSPDYETPDLSGEYNLFMCYSYKELGENRENLFLTYFPNEDHNKKTTVNYIRSYVEEAKGLKDILADYTPVEVKEHTRQYGYYRMGYFEDSVYNEYIIYLEDTPEFNLRYGDSYYMLSEEDINAFRNICIESFGKMGEIDRTVSPLDYIDFDEYD